MIIEDRAKIVFAGDSVTDDGRERPVGEGSGLGNGFVRLIDVFLTTAAPDRYYRLLNAGISGNTSADLLARWESDICAHDPDWVVLCIGFNDVWRQFDFPTNPESAVPPEEYRKNLNAMADKTKAKMIWMTPYFLEPNAKEPMRARMDEYGAIMKEEAKKRGILCVDLQAAFKKILRYRHPSSICWDRVHPNRTGSMIIARAFLEAVGFKI